MSVQVLSCASRPAAFAGAHAERTVRRALRRFLQSQQVGAISGNANSWRHESLLQEYAIPFAGKTFNFGGGYMQGGQVGTVKATMPLAWVTTMLAWGAMDFKVYRPPHPVGTAAPPLTALVPRLMHLKRCLTSRQRPLPGRNML